MDLLAIEADEVTQAFIKERDSEQNMHTVLRQRHVGSEKEMPGSKSVYEADMLSIVNICATCTPIFKPSYFHRPYRIFVPHQKQKQEMVQMPNFPHGRSMLLKCMAP